MKNIRPAWILCAALLALPVFSQQAVADQGPRIQLSERTFDCGTVEEGKALEHEFKVFNRGDQPLVIERVSPS
jgi:hypothetical protein